MSERNKMICAKCGTEMNYHAEKINYNIDASGKTAAIFGGTVEEVHSCPQCGEIEVRAEE